MKYFICVGHANYGGGVISSADGTSKGGVNEYKYNKELAPYVCKWLKVAGHEATLCIAPEGQLHSLNDEIKYFIEEEHKQNYDLSVQLHLNAQGISVLGIRMNNCTVSAHSRRTPHCPCSRQGYCRYI